ncbi:MAG TPA: alpha/beta hydrolase, partial [Acidimicrobiales bacterium]
MSVVPSSSERVHLADGRVLEASMSGAPEGPAVVFQHGSPGSSFDHPGFGAAAAARGLRVIAPSRSGYAGSTRLEGRAVAAAASDVAELLDHLGIGRFATLGWSGGGPHALGCAALLPDRCAAALSVCGPAPYLPDEFDWTEGMGAENVEEFSLSLEGGPAYDEMLETLRTELLSIDPASVRSARDLFGGLVSDIDDAAVAPVDAAFMLANVCRGLDMGVGGWRDDDQAFLRPWGFDVTDIAVPVGVWFGDQDLMVPARHG